LNVKNYKAMKYFLLLFLALTINSCANNDDDNGLVGPISQLPPATQTGANTFGALLDGEPFIPSGGINPLDGVYQLINGERYLNVQATKRDEDFNRIGLSLSLSLSLSFYKR
jgi:hypothetical protein